MRRWAIILVLTAVLFPCGLSARVGETAGGDAVVFGKSVNQVQLDAMTVESVRQVREVLEELGRFRPVEKNRVRSVLEGLAGRGGNTYREAARMLDVDIYMTVEVNRRGREFIGILHVRSLDKRYGSLARTIRVNTSVPANIPVRLARKVAHFHKRIPIFFTILESRGEGRYRIDAGQWHGLETGDLPIEGSSSGRVLRLERFESLVYIPHPAAGSGGIIPMYRDIRPLVRELDRKTVKNTVRRYTVQQIVARGEDSGKKFIESLVVMNPGSNFCLPVYGSFLTTGFMGLPGKKPSWAGIALTSTLLVSHFLAPEIIANFDVSFWPWVMDPDKTKGMQNLQIYTWAALPMLFTAAYLDQLAYQMKRHRYLPPFFENRNLAALGISSVIPGGGLFYKGHRMLGWGFYIAEMGLLGAGLYRLYDPDGKYIFIALGALKAAELITAFFIPTGYPFFNRELARTDGVRFIPVVRPGILEEKEIVMGMGCVKRF